MGVIPWSCNWLRSLKVPEAIHNAWTKGGIDRERLKQQFQEAGFDKERARLHELSSNSTKLVRPCFGQDTFVRRVLLEQEKQESLTFRGKAFWASEDKLRSLKYTERLGFVSCQS